VGLSWSYTCCVESDIAESKTSNDGGQVTGYYGEGEFIIYYSGFEYPQLNHARLMLTTERGEDESVYCISSWGVQGPGEHYDNPIRKATKKLIKEAVGKYAEYLRSVRKPIIY